MIRKFAFTLMVAFALLFAVSLTAAETCRDYPGPQLSLSTGVVDEANGKVPITVTYSFARPSGGYWGQRVLMWIQKNGVWSDEIPLKYAADQGTVEAIIDLSCALPPHPVIVHVRASEAFGSCPVAFQSATFAADSTPRGSIAASDPDDDGVFDVALDYEFPFSGAGWPADIRVYDPDGIKISDARIGLQQRGTHRSTLNLSCRPPGTYRIEASLRGCVTKDVSTTVQVGRYAPEIELEVEDERDEDGGQVAHVSWNFAGPGGRVRVVTQVPGQAGETVIADFTPDAQSGSRDIPFVATSFIVKVVATATYGCEPPVTREVTHQCQCQSVGDPVDIANGNMRYSDADPIAAGGMTGLSRVYDSRQPVIGRFGQGWTSLFDASITLSRPSSILIVTETNDASIFIERGAIGGQQFEQRWPRSSSRHALTHDATTNVYRLTDASGATARIYSGVTGRLVELRDLASDRAVQLDYDASGNPTRVRDSWGAWSWTVTTDAATRLVTSIAVDGPTSLTWSYQYDAARRLQTVTAPGSLPWRTYEYAAGPMTAARDGAGKLIESHDYDAYGWATSSVGPSGEISTIEYALPGAVAGETITRVTTSSGQITNYRTRLEGGTRRVVAVEGGCAACGSGDRTVAYDAFGLVFREQDARGSITESHHDERTHRLLSRTTHLRPRDCDPETDPAHCRMTSEALRDAVLPRTTAATVKTSYEYGDAKWRDRPTTIMTNSVINALREGPRVATSGEGDASNVRRETLVYDPASGEVLVRGINGWTGEPARYETRTTTTTLYDGATSASFHPGGTYFQSTWTSLPQPRGMRHSIDGPRTDVDDRTLFVYYPNDPSVPASDRGRLAAVKNAAGHVTRYEQYDIFGNATRVVDPNGVVTQSTLDGLGRLLTTTVKGVPGCDTAADPLCATDLTTTRSYAGAGPLAFEQRPSGGVAVYTYDPRGRVETISRGPSANDLREQMAYVYDAASGKKSAEIIRRRNGTGWEETKRETYAYTPEGELQTITQTDGASVSYTYDAAHQVASVREEGHDTPNTRYEYDPAGRVRRVIQALSTAPEGEIVTSYGYDAHGNLTGVSDPNGNVTGYSYDDFGQMTRQISPVTGTTSYEYNAAGQLVRTTDANGATTTRTYDAVGRPLTAVSTRDSASETITWTYDDPTTGRFSIGRLSRASDPAGATTYSYERRGLLRAETRTFPTSAHTYTTTFRYDADGNRSAIGYPSGQQTVTYTYDFAGRPLTASGVITGAEYLPFGPLAKLSFANGTTQTLTYDARYRIASHRLSLDGMSGPAASLAHYAYEYDPRGNISTINDTLDAEYRRTFEYDTLNRLTVANTGRALWKKGVFSWDAMGNILTMNLDEVEPGPGDGMRSPNPKKNRPPDDARTRPLGRTSAFTYSGSTPILESVALNDVSRPVTHDAAGNQLAYSATRTYSPRNFLHQIEDAAEPGETLRHIVAYGYDARGVRVTRAESPSNGENTTAHRYYVYTPELQLLAETHDDSINVWESATPPPGIGNDVKWEFVWFAGRPVAQLTPGAAPLYTFTDHLGTPIVQTDTTRTITWRAEYEPFGNVYLMRAGTRTAQPLRFPGQEVATTWEGAEERYNLFRWYQSGWGRYNQADRWSLFEPPYGYVRGNAVSRIDPTGQLTIHLGPVNVHRVDRDIVIQQCSGGAGTLGCMVPTNMKYSCQCRCISMMNVWKKEISIIGDSLDVYASTNYPAPWGQPGVVDVELIVREEMRHVTEIQEWARNIRDSLEYVEAVLHTSASDCRKSCDATYDWLAGMRRWRMRQVDGGHPF